MTPIELQAFRRLLFLSAAEAARYVAADLERPHGVEERTWNRWEAGDRPVPANIASAVVALVRCRALMIDNLASALACRGSDAAPLPWVADPDDWGRDRALWRAHQSACAAVLASAPPGTALLAPASQRPALPDLQ
jgi:hypothetical protein